MHSTLTVVLAIAGLSGPPATRPEAPPDPAPASDCPVAQGADDWAGRYQAGEGIGGENPMVMTYQVDVFRDAAGRWRAYVMITGQTTFRELRACGIATPRGLELRGRARDADEDDAVESIMTIERARRGSFRFRIEGGSYLVNEPVISADRIAIPPWAGVYAADTCKGGGAAPCWRYGFDVSLVDDGFQALVSVDGPATTERLVARGEDGMLAGGNSVLFLTFVRAAAGDAHTGPSRNDQSTGKLVRRKDGSLWVELNGLPGPTGVREVPLSVQPKP